jgi:hypothetical protein
MAVEDERHRDNRWFVLAKALADYRAGQFNAALAGLEHFTPEEGGVHCDSSAFAIRSMTQQRLGQSQAASKALASAQAILARTMPDPKQGRLFGDNWLDWLHAQILCREAESLLNSKN